MIIINLEVAKWGAFNGTSTEGEPIEPTSWFSYHHLWQHDSQDGRSLSTNILQRPLAYKPRDSPDRRLRTVSNGSVSELGPKQKRYPSNIKRIQTCFQRAALVVFVCCASTERLPIGLNGLVVSFVFGHGTRVCDPAIFSFSLGSGWRPVFDFRPKQRLILVTT